MNNDIIKLAKYVKSIYEPRIHGKRSINNLHDAKVAARWSTHLFLGMPFMAFGTNMRTWMVS